MRTRMSESITERKTALERTMTMMRGSVFSMELQTMTGVRRREDDDEQERDFCQSLDQCARVYVDIRIRRDAKRRVLSDSVWCETAQVYH